MFLHWIKKYNPVTPTHRCHTAYPITAILQIFTDISDSINVPPSLHELFPLYSRQDFRMTPPSWSFSFGYIPGYHTLKVTARTAHTVIARIISPKYLLPLCIGPSLWEDYDPVPLIVALINGVWVEVYHFWADLKELSLGLSIFISSLPWF